MNTSSTTTNTCSSVFPPPSAPARLRPGSGNSQDDLPPQLITANAPLKPMISSLSFEPDAVESTAELINLYCQVLQEHLSSQELCHRCAPISQLQLNDYSWDHDDFSEDDDGFEDNEDNDDDDDDDMSVFSMSSSCSMDHLFSDVDSIQCRLQSQEQRRVGTPEHGCSTAMESSPIRIVESDADSLASSFSACNLSLPYNNNE
ncbi:hypothetical protein SEMRO_802_G204680.1 [Seminavis robusta]|uniref:Uncharacterized protein n=1 Tax=Seminavis robusta TaxID=568900 RepID=A0A9N8EDX9_9STRA|nr:hypothetical protein SEMRO_802_G204680.1 [Seminavis robusta]|eukprot:Sro802_g204680.1 n/a (203) ;mRNA; r:28143-28751